MPTVLITGANRGIGLEFARQYAADGWDVVATARQSSPELDALGVPVEPLDLHDLEAVTGFRERIGGSLDLLIANAGTWIPETSETAEDGRQWTEMMVANCIAPCLLAKAVAPAMPSGGKIVALSSGMGSIAQASTPGYIPYRTSKAALNMAMRALAIELRGRGLITATFDPGWVKTRMGGPNAQLDPQESVGPMRATIERLGPDDSGGYFSRDGKPIPW
jgi:NAD(P)-dependent dehydrogenase (short-subunit alcohol dehydrogenase family)